MNIINFAYAANDAAASQPSVWASLVPMALIMVVFYIFLIRPSHQKIKDHQKTVASLKKGDKIITSGGIFATITSCYDDAFDIEIAPNVICKVKKEMVGELVAKPEVVSVETKSQKKSKKKEK